MDVTFSLTDSVIPVPLDDIETGAVVAAQTALGRFDEPVDREESLELERAFAAVAHILREAGADLGFAIVPEPPFLGVYGAIVVRWSPAPSDDAVQQAIDESFRAGDFLLEQPIVEQRETALGTATRVHHRFAVDSESFGDSASATANAVDSLGWYWHLEDPGGPDTLLVATSIVSDLERTIFIAALLDEFAEHIERA